MMKKPAKEVHRFQDICDIRDKTNGANKSSIFLGEVLRCYANLLLVHYNP